MTLPMSSGALFPSLVSGSRGSSSKYLVEFRAGKMTLKGNTVTPDKRKGLVYIQQSDDSLIHFCWKDRTTGNVDDDLIIFPDDCEFKRVNQCTTGRVYVLKFKAGSKRLFFWMQFLCCHLITSSPSFSFAAPAQTPVAPASVGSPPPHQHIQLSDLQSILANMNVPAAAAAQVDLASVCTPEMMAPILTNAEVQQRLLPFLPSGESLPQSAEEIQNTLNSPQFQQSMSMFSSALASGQLGPLMSQFGLSAEAVDAANRGDVEAFARAMQGSKGDSKEKKEDDEDMSLD
uniref:ADRM1 26S proteasome ubiquitin receptor n=1 Tax=Cyprinodon variegatus TaxID=28743 RepID=A0A3Q2DER8_CYPVA